MGFFENMFDEAGTKAGKAIGNKLFGKLGADETINVNTNVDHTSGPNRSNGGLTGLATTMLENSKTSDELQLKQYEDKEAIKKELRDTEFDNINAQNNYAILLKLIPIIESEIKHCYLHEGEVVDEEGLYELARSKYSTWLTMLEIQDATNPKIVLFRNKEKEWDNYWQSQQVKNKKDTKTLLIVLLAIVAIPILILILGNIFWWW